MDNTKAENENEPRPSFVAWFSLAAVYLRDALFPPTCLVCHVATSRTGTLCPSCWNKVKFIERPFCEVLGTPFGTDQGDGVLSGDAIANPPPFHRSRAVALYGPIARKLVQSLKYNDRTDLAPWMAQWMARAGAELVSDCDVIVPVPLHPLRFFSRRFNQSAELARALSRFTGKPFDPSLLIRTRRTKQQVGLGALQRQDNVRGAFQVPAELKINFAGKTILLIDDVYTTGATIFAATKALKKAGAKSVDVLTFARVIPGDFSLEELEAI
jgi:ComF family protein